MPKNYRDLRAAVKWAAQDRLTVVAEAPPSVTLELAARRNSSEWLLHLVNFNVNRLVENILVHIRAPAGMRLEEVSAQTPDGGPAHPIKAAVRGDVASFRIPRLKVYDLIILRYATVKVSERFSAEMANSRATR